jgi:hypothetical protein
MALAQQHGLPVAPMEFFSGVEAREQFWTAHCWPTVLGSHVLGLPADVQVSARGCTELARAAECDLMGLHFSRSVAGEWLFQTATPLPDLRAGGRRMVDLLVSELTA